MRDCVTVPTETSTLPPNKRVNYSYGMVMDVDAFLQEQTHFEWKHALGNRLLHGYGTVCGLEVHSEPDGTDVKILVEPGYAVSPAGAWIWVEEQLCALLNAWVQNNRDDSGGAFAAPGPNRVFITLCYDKCPTDLVPIAGRACATDEDTRAPSRILETVRADFSWERPEQIAEDAASQLGDILAAVVFTDDPTEDESGDLLALIAMLGEVTSPPLSPVDSPPGIEEIRLWQETACDTIREALVMWVTGVCPRLQKDPGDCILLACVDFQVDIGGRVLPLTIEVDNCERPVLLPTRLQQELFCLLGNTGVGTSEHGNLLGLGDDDHPQYLTEARGDARYSPLGHIHALDELGDVDALGPVDGEVLSWDDTAGKWQPASPAAAHTHNLDDLGDVDVPSPVDGEVLTWDAGTNEWQAEPVEVEAGEEDLTRIVALSWFHDLQNLISIVHDGNQETGLAIAFGKNELGDGGMVQAAALNEHLYQVFVEQLVGGGLAAPVRIIPTAIVPVDILNVSGGRITETATSKDTIVPGVLFIFDPAVFNNELSDIVRIVMHGDFILDETGKRAIDAEHVRAQLPTGDRPQGAERGIQGGRFESWLIRNQDINEFIDINSAPAELLDRLPDIGGARAEAIIANRPYATVEELVRVSGISDEIVNDIRGLITVRQ